MSDVAQGPDPRQELAQLGHGTVGKDAQQIEQSSRRVVKLFGAGIGNLDSYGSGTLISADGHAVKFHQTSTAKGNILNFNFCLHSSFYFHSLTNIVFN